MVCDLLHRFHRRARLAETEAKSSGSCSFAADGQDSTAWLIRYQGHGFALQGSYLQLRLRVRRCLQPLQLASCLGLWEVPVPQLQRPVGKILKKMVDDMSLFNIAARLKTQFRVLIHFQDSRIQNPETPSPDIVVARCDLQQPLASHLNKVAPPHGCTGLLM